MNKSGGLGGGGGGGGGSGSGSGGSGSGGGGGGGAGAGRGGAVQRGGFSGGQCQQQPRSRETPSAQQLREWYAGRGRSGGVGPCTYVLHTGGRRGETQNVAIFYLDVDANLAAMYAVSESAKGDCYLSVQPNPGIEAAALGASAFAATGTGESAAPGTSESAAPSAGESALSGTAPTEALHTFTLDSSASRSFFRDSTTLTQHSRPVAVSLADPSRGPVLTHSSTVLPCPAAPSGLLSGLHLPSFSTNLVSGADLQDLWVDQFTPKGMASRTLVSGLPRSLPPLPSGPAPTCVPCVEGRQHAAPHSSEFPPTEAPLQTLHMDVWGPAHVSGQGHERYFLLVVDDYSCYTTVFPLRRKDRGGEFSSDLLRAFCQAEGIRQMFTLPASPQQNGIAERRIGMVMDVARTSMIHAAAPHFLWPFADQYAAHQINLQPRVSLPETTPTFAVDGEGWRCVCVPCPFYHPTSRRVLSSRDVTFDESVSYYGLFPYCTASLPPPPLFLAPGAPPVDPLPPQGPAPSGVSQVDPVEPVEVAVDSGAARGVEPAGAGPGGAEHGVADSEGAEPWGAEPERVKPGGAKPGGAEPERAKSGGPPVVPSRWEPLSPQRLREWYARRCSRAAGATEPTAGGASGAGAAGGAGGARATGAAGPGGAGVGGTGAVGGPTGVGAAGGTGAAGPRAVGAGAVATGGAAGGGADGTGAVATGGVAGARAAGGTRAGGAAGVVAGDPGAEGICAVSAPASPLPGPSPYSGPTRGLTERREPESRPALPESHPASLESLPGSLVRAVCTGRRVPHQRPPPVPGTHSMTLRPSTAPQRVPLPSPPAFSFPDGPDPESDSLRAASPLFLKHDNALCACAQAIVIRHGDVGDCGSWDDIGDKTLRATMCWT
ncbi:unnamed protein product [Closterium sp. NIES-53]